MIFSDSRYADGIVYKAQDSRSNTYETSVARVFPIINTDYYMYVWKEGDRIDSVAYRLLSNPADWWYIMDANPEVTDPMNIVPGTYLRIPRV